MLEKKEKFLISTGFSLVEVLLAMALFSIIITVFVVGILEGRESSRVSGNREIALSLAQEGLEAARSIRNNTSTSFASALPAGDHGINTASPTYSFSGSSDVQDIFTRVVSISDVDVTKKAITSEITWQQNPQRQGSVSLFTWLTDWQEALPTIIGWTSVVQGSSLDIPLNGNGYKVRIKDNYAYLVRQAPNPEFAVIDISNPSSLSLAGFILDLAGSTTGLRLSGNYAFVGSSDNSNEFLVVNISNPLLPAQVASLNLPGNSNVNAMGISGNYAYTVRTGTTDSFVVVNISNPLVPTVGARRTINCTCSDIYISGNYAYIASTNNSEELIVMNISNPANPTQTAVLNLPGNNDAKSINGYGSYIYIGRDDGELDVINISNPASPTLVSSAYSALSAINSIALNSDGNILLLATDENTAEFQAVNISNPATPTLLSSLNTDDDLNGIAYKEDFAIAVSDSNTQEVISIIPN